MTKILRDCFMTGLICTAAFGCARYPYAPSGAAWPPPGGGTLPGSALPPVPNSALQPPTVSGLPPAGEPFPNIQRPNWSAPGTLGQQQASASVHDPYADNNAGPPIEGGRPREFAQPRSEAARSNQSVRWPY